MFRICDPSTLRNLARCSTLGVARVSTQQVSRKEGGRVLAYDPSEGMLDRLRNRCAASVANGRVLPVSGDLENLYAALPSFGDLGAVVANFGVVNLVSDLAQFTDLVAVRLPRVQGDNPRRAKSILFA